MPKSSGWFKTVSKPLAVLVVAALGSACTTQDPTSPTMSAVVDDAGGSGAPTALAADPCADVTAVRLSLVPAPKGRILVRAQYLELGIPACGTRPAWNTVPQGLVRPTNDPFVVRIADTPAAGVIVTAASPNGKQGRLRIR